MSQTFHCGDNAGLVGYLYDECQPAERLAIEQHLQLCPACAAELAALDATRLHLSSWTPPEAELGFQVVRAQATGADPRGELTDETVGVRPAAYPASIPWWRQPLPAWAQAAAAIVIFGAGLAMGVARGVPPAAAPAAAPAVASAPAAAETSASARDLAALEQRMFAELSRIQNAEPATPAASEAQLLARVRGLIEESERRQQRELALRTAQIVRDFDSQRQVDLAHIRRTFGQIEGLTGAEVREQRQMLDYLIRTSQQR